MFSVTAELVQDGMICLQQMLDGQMMEVHVTSTLSFSEKAASSDIKEDGECTKLSASSSEEEQSPATLIFPSAIPSPESATPCDMTTPNSQEAVSTSPTTSSSSPAAATSSPSSPEDPSLKLVPLAPYIPVVELYIQRGAQVGVYSYLIYC